MNNQFFTLKTFGGGGGGGAFFLGCCMLRASLGRILKTCADAIAPALTCIYRRSLQTGQLPADWWSANISAVFKKGDRNKAENYRPVSLTSVACKLLEHIICRHLRNHLDRHNILTDRNHGFRSGYSCETQLITTLHDLFEPYDAGKQTDVVILDFSKAFNMVPHNKLLHKLNHYGVRGPIHKWLTNFLTKRKMRVVLEGKASGEATVDSGVPQGTMIGPLLFLCHINDLPEAVKSKVRLFADDCLLYWNINTPQDHITLQEDLRHLEDWAKKWGMRFNAQKCYILSSRSKSTHMYSLSGVFLKQVQQHPYLGMIILDDLKWGKHIAYISRKGGATVGFLRRNLRNCPKECRRLAYIVLVRSRLEYAETVWDPYYQQDIEKLERVQRQAARFITKDYRTREPGCVNRMLQDLILPPLAEHCRQACLGLMYKITGGLIPAIPPQNYLTPVSASRRRIRPTKYEDFEATNIIDRHEVRNTRGFQLPAYNTKQYQNSFFVPTVVDWNHLEENIVKADSASAFTSALSRSTPPAP